MKSNIVIAGGLLLLVVIVITTSDPQRIRVERNSITEHGVVSDMYETAFKDLVVKLQGQGATFYIKNDRNDKMSLSSLRDKLLNKRVVIQYKEPISKSKSEHFISKLELENEGEVIYLKK